MIDDEGMIVFPQHLLANADVSKIFAEIMLEYLISHMNDLGMSLNSPSYLLITLIAGPHAGLHLQLFKLVFRSISAFPDNESVLQPYVAPIITKSMSFARDVSDSSNYFYLLRELFRGISNSGKYNEFAKEFLPLLSSLLEGLNILQESSHPPALKELFIELSLRIPVKLSALLPSLKLLIKPLVMSIETEGELVRYGI